VTLITTNNEKEEILFTLHDDSIQGVHSCITKTLAKVKGHYYWKGMNKVITQYIHKCPKCQKSKTTKHTKTLLTLTEMIFDKVIVDTIVPLPKSD